MNKPPKKVLDYILKSLRDSPDDWRFSTHDAVNEKLHAKIWMSNRYYGTELTVGSCQWGGVTTASTLFSSLFISWRRHLVLAAQNANLNRVLGQWDAVSSEPQSSVAHGAVTSKPPLVEP